MVSKTAQALLKTPKACKYLSMDDWAGFFEFAEDFMLTQYDIGRSYFDIMNEICKIAQKIEPHCFELAGFLPRGAILDLNRNGLVLSHMVNIKSIHSDAICAPNEDYIVLPPDVVKIEPFAINASKSYLTFLYPGTKEEFNKNLKNNLNYKSNKIYKVICDDNYIYEPTR